MVEYIKKDGVSYKLWIIGSDDDTIYYCVDNGKTRYASEHYVCKFGGNPHPGTIIKWYQIILPNGKKYKYNIYA